MIKRIEAKSPCIYREFQVDNKLVTLPARVNDTFRFTKNELSG